MPRVLNRWSDSAQDLDRAVYVGRPSKWGNPFHMNARRKRAFVVARFEAWLLTQPDLVAAAKIELRGRDLACYCAPLKCHAEVLLKIANE